VIDTSYVRQDDSVVIRPSGPLDHLAATALRHAVAHSVHRGIDLLLDLGDVDSIDAVGISALVGTVRRTRALGGSTTIYNVGSDVRERMAQAGVAHLLDPRVEHSGHDAA
jgi:anti-anti-sigma factor